MQETNTDRAERFWLKVILHKADQCWRWNGPLSEKGYGLFSVGGKPQPAHRISYMLEHGRSIPSGMLVRHRCDNPACVNPYHLVLGTNVDNSNDGWERGRMSYRDWVGTSKLTKCQVEAIQVRGLVEDHGVLANEFGISRSVIQKIVSRTAPVEILRAAQ
jgi:hypothetical protein